MKRHLVIVGMAAAILMLPSTALAQPASDDFGSATTVIEPLPFSHSTSTVGATSADTDPPCGGATVWYAYTPSTSGRIAADTIGSDYDTTLWVGTGSPDELVTIGCNDDAFGLQSFVSWDAVAGTTYYIMAGSCCDSTSPGGNLVLNVGAPPPPPQLDISIDAVGTFDSRSGTATIRGTVDCSDGNFVDGFGTIRQRVGRDFVTGEFSFSFEECSQDMPWSATITGSGVFAGGKATVNVSVFTCSPIDCVDDSTSRIVRLRGGPRSVAT
jgi:hypothetical protein